MEIPAKRVSACRGIPDSPVGRAGSHATHCTRRHLAGNFFAPRDGCLTTSAIAAGARPMSQSTGRMLPGRPARGGTARTWRRGKIGARREIRPRNIGLSHPPATTQHRRSSIDLVCEAASRRRFGPAESSRASARGESTSDPLGTWLARALVTQHFAALIYFIRSAPLGSLVHYYATAVTIRGMGRSVRRYTHGADCCP